MGNDVRVLRQGVDLGGRGVVCFGRGGGDEADGQDHGGDRLGEHFEFVGYAKPRTGAKGE